MNLWYSIVDLLPFEWAQPGSMFFMKNALLAVLVISPLFGLLSTMVVESRMSFFSDALGHSAFTGIAIGTLLGSTVTLFSAAARAGVPGKSIDAAARKVIEEAGYGEYFGHGYGHSVGIEIHESPNANTRDESLMPVGAAVSAEPGIYLPGKFGVRIEDVTILTENGCIDITQSPKELIIL